MPTYSNILVGLDLTPDSLTILKKAHTIATQNNANLLVTHIIEPLAFAYGGDVPVNLAEAQDMMGEQASTRLASLVQETGIDVQEKIIAIGDTASELRRLAEERDVDLILVGSHGRHGLALLFGSTASGVLRGAPCDVLAIRIKTSTDN